MGRFATDPGGGDFQQAPVGTHVARCIKLIDLGTQRNEYLGEVSMRNQILVMWELCNEMMETDNGTKPFIVSKFYTNSLNEKASLRLHLAQWRGRDFTEAELSKFDLQSILGAACMISVIADEKGKSRVGGVMKMPKGQVAPEPQNPKLAFWLDEFRSEVFEGLSDGIKKIIQKSPEYAEATGAGARKEQPLKRGHFDDLEEIPF